jgi:hypothetical protein
MIKRGLAAFFVLVVGLSLVGSVNAEEINGCLKKENGQFRVLLDPDDVCLPSEIPMTLNSGNGNGSCQENFRLDCITAVISYDPADVDPTDYCNSVPRVAIFSPNIITDPSIMNPLDYVEVVCESPIDTLPISDDVAWGLRCRTDLGWENTGCNSSSANDYDGYPDIAQFNSGCYSDDEEIGNINIFTTCCKVVAE